MKGCKYLLPCGWCDKYDRRCNVSLEEFEFFNKEEQCNHNWVTEKAETATKEEAGCVTYYTLRCSICGKKRIKRVEVDGNHHFDVTMYEEEEHE